MRRLPRADTRVHGAMLAAFAALAASAALLPAHAGAAPEPGIDWVRVGHFEIARTETSIGQFRRYADATTGFVSAAERAGGGEVYEDGWVHKPGWHWRAPFGRPAHDDEPAVHLRYDEAQAYCRWAGGRLPTDPQWTAAAYTEQRAAPPPPFERGRSYPYPTGERPDGAQCLDDCGDAARERAVAHGARLTRGHGHARVGSTPAGVNGLHDMGANAWEWVDDPPGLAGNAQRLTRGGSWWYGAAQMHAGHRQSKPGDTAVVYIGFRCLRDVRR